MSYEKLYHLNFNENSKLIGTGTFFIIEKNNNTKINEYIHNSVNRENVINQINKLLIFNKEDTNKDLNLQLRIAKPIPCDCGGYLISAKCPECDGYGSVEAEYDGIYSSIDGYEVDCPVCEGRGTITNDEREDFNIPTNILKKAKWEAFKPECPKCKGTGSYNKQYYLLEDGIGIDFDLIDKRVNIKNILYIPTKTLFYYENNEIIWGAMHSKITEKYLLPMNTNDN